MPDTMLLAIGGVILGLMIFTMGYNLISSSVVQTQKQIFVDQFANINANLDSVCSQEPGNFLVFDMQMPNQVRVFYTTDNPDDVLPTVTDKINSNDLGEGNYL
ncbi:MAG: hypothetical protein J4428_04355, partial [Candidatus Aenigmarchaeota archaeon]|nr:hypothetical protein [Candidatus Aenigmarchaeota archaeon]